MEDKPNQTNDEQNLEEEHPTENKVNQTVEPESESQLGAAPESIPEALPVSGEVFTPQPSEASAAGPAAPTFIRRATPWVIVSVAALLVGFMLCFFLLYQPAVIRLNQTTADWVAARDRLSETENELQTAQNSLKQMQANLETVQSELASASFNQVLAEVQANVAFARLALATMDLLTARQELSAAEGNLRLLTSMLSDMDTAEALEERLATIRSRLITDSSQAMEELRILSENLSRIERR